MDEAVLMADKADANGQALRHSSGLAMCSVTQVARARRQILSISESPSTHIAAASVWRDALYCFCFKAKLTPIQATARVEAFITDNISFAVAIPKRRFT